MLNRIIQIISLVILFTLLILNRTPLYSDSQFLNIILLIDLICTLSFFIIRKERYTIMKSQYLRFSFFFVISLITVHFQAYIDLSIGNLDADNNFLWINKDIINKAVVLSSIGLISFFLGYSFKNNISRNENANSNDKIINIKYISVLNLLFFLLFLTQINADFLNSSLYGVGKRESTILLGYSMLLFECSMFAIIILNVYNFQLINRILKNKVRITFIDYIKEFNYSLLVLFVYLVLIALSGDRGPIVYLVLGFLIGYITTTKIKLSKIYIIIIIIIGASLVTILGIVRSSNVTNVKDIITLKEKNIRYPKSFSPATTELAGSIFTLHLAVDNIPQSLPHTNGLFLIQNATVIVPGLNSTINKVFEIPPIYFSSSNLLTFLYLGKDPTWGVGTSCIADTYMDFGYLGVFIIFLLFGVFTRHFELKTFVKKDSGLVSLTTYILFFSFSIYIARSNLIVPFTKIPYVLFFCYLPVLLKKE